MINQENLSNINSEENEIYNKDRYVVMDILYPFVSENYIISSRREKIYNKNGDELLEKIKITNELGIYGVLIWYF